MNWGVLFFACLGLALAALWLAGRNRATTGLPAGRLVYADTTRWRPVERPLFSHTHRLTGRPDYVVQHRRALIPVEVKSGHAPHDGPYTSHVLQLAAYCLLIKETHGRPPPHGIIVYTEDAESAHEIDYAPELEEELLAILEEMRLAWVQGDAPRDHDQVARCRACGYRHACDESLA